MVHPASGAPFAMMASPALILKWCVGSCTLPGPSEPNDAAPNLVGDTAGLRMSENHQTDVARLAFSCLPFSPDRSGLRPRGACSMMKSKLCTCVWKERVSLRHGEGTGSILMDDVNCVGNETSLDQCTWSGHPDLGAHNCGHSEDQGLACSSQPWVGGSVDDYFDMRLAGENSYTNLDGAGGYYAGRIEVRQVKDAWTWKTVCDDSFDTNDAMVACRMMGLPTDYVYQKQAAFFGQGSGTIGLDNMNCVGTETNFLECGWYGKPSVDMHNCGHHEDVGVVCSTIPNPI